MVSLTPPISLISLLRALIYVKKVPNDNDKNCVLEAPCAMKETCFLILKNPSKNVHFLPKPFLCVI